MLFRYGVLLFTVGISSSTSQTLLDVFGSRLSYQPPDSLVWVLDEKSHDEEMHRGVVMYKRATVYDSDGMAVQPVVAIVYEKLRDTTDAVTYSIGKRVSSTFRWKVRHVFDPDSTEYGNAVFYEGEYDKEDIKHMLIIAHATHGLVGIQAIGDATEGVFQQVESDMKRFVHSINLGN
jgi:hypothetical protein